MRMRPLVVVVVALAAAVSAAAVQEPTTGPRAAPQLTSEPPQAPSFSRETTIVILDPEASRVSFTLGATFHTVHGSFRLREGKINFDPATGAAAGAVVVAATSGNSGNEKRDRDMHAKVLESETFPEIVFVPERIEGTLSPGEASRLVLHGRLDIHGTTHPIAIEADVRIDDGTVEAEGRFEVPYVEWGMKDPSKFILRVAKSVEIEIHAVGRLTAKAVAATADPGA